MVKLTDYDYIKPMVLTYHLYLDVLMLLEDYPKTREHVLSVALTSQKLAKQFHLNEKICYQSALLHDIGVIMKPMDMKTLMDTNHYTYDSAEEKYPFLLHQQISAIIAKDIFNISNQHILDAIACHTTLKADPNAYDMVLFLADKISWDQEGIPPYLDLIEKGLAVSLEKACYEYIRYVFQNHLLLYPHRQIKQARDYLYQKYLPIQLRDWQNDEGAEFYKHSHNDELYQFMNQDFPRTEEACEKLIKAMNKSDDIMKAILLDGEIVGNVAAFIEDEKAKIAYFLDYKYWNQGIMSAALEQFIQYLLKDKSISVFYAQPHQNNIASQHLLLKSQFQENQGIYERKIL